MRLNRTVTSKGSVAPIATRDGIGISQETAMKFAILILVLISGTFVQFANSEKTASDRLRIELRASASRVRMTDEIMLTVFFRSPEREVTIWNALGWGAPAGLYLQVLDSSGREVRNDFAPFFHPMPPDETGKDALISIGGKSFAGFDSQIPANALFPGPGRYTLKCLYSPPLSRDYFKGHTIWGKEDGAIESSAVAVTVDVQ
jgi:hypothetical protein